MVKERIHYIDILKAICILLIVGLHTQCNIFPGRTDAMLQAFRIPMYYFLSGLFFKTYSGSKEFLSKKTDSLIIPFLFFYGLACLAAIIFSEVFHLYDKGLMGDKWEWHYLYEPLVERNFHFSVALWFLLSLFEVNIIYMLLNKLKPWGKYIGVVACAAIGYTLMYYKIELPVYLDTALVALPYFVFGNELKKFDMLRRDRGAKWGLILIVPLFILLYFIAQPLNLFDQLIPNPVSLYIVPMASIGVLLLFCKNLPYIPVINHIGRYSLIVLGTHSQLISAIRPFVTKFLGQDMLAGIVIILIIVAIELLVIPIFIKLFPHLTAQKPLIASKFAKRQISLQTSQKH